MENPLKTYTRLTRNASGVGTYSSLWLAADHLLIVTSTGYNESYSRVRFRDVKGFFVTPSARRLWWGVTWGILAVVTEIIMINVLIKGQRPIFSGIFVCLFLGALTWNHLLGEGCGTFVVTGVQTARLRPLVRLKEMHRVLGLLRPLIEAAQSDLVPTPPIHPVTPPTMPPPT